MYEPIEILGTFDGEKMWGDNNKIYRVPPNYASKSKLLEGDRLKLVIMEDGTFIYKQIGRVDAKRITGTFQMDMSVLAENKTYQIIPASITYYKAQPGDNAVILVPKEGKSSWAALENMIYEEDLDKEMN